MPNSFKMNWDNVLACILCNTSDLLKCCGITLIKSLCGFTCTVILHPIHDMDVLIRILLNYFKLGYATQKMLFEMYCNLLTYFGYFLIKWWYLMVIMWINRL